jgi:hypothetical protein
MTPQPQITENPFYITLKVSFDEYERDHGDGYYPLFEHSIGDAVTYETFHLNNSGQWTQENIYDAPENADEKAQRFGRWSDLAIREYLNIKGLDGDTGINLLNWLNGESARIQMVNGVPEGAVRRGDCILNLKQERMKVTSNR